MVNDVRYGFLADTEDLPDFDGIIIYIVPQPISVPRENIFRFSFNLICMDELFPDKTNFETIISDTASVLMDIYSALLYQDDKIGTWLNATGSLMTPFQERFSSFMAGNNLSVSMDVFQSNCLDAKPFAPLPDPPPPPAPC